MKFAVFESGSQQFLVKVGDKIRISKIAGATGEEVRFEKVLLAGEGDDVAIGRPYLAGTVVGGKVLKQARAKKVLVMKYHSKTRYRRKKGHRQHYTEVEITKV